MSYLFRSFKTFFEEMDSDMEKMSGSDPIGKDPVGNDYIDTLEDEFGINWKSISSTLTSEPWIATHFKLGDLNDEMTYKISAWEIDKDTITPEGAYIRLKPTKGMRGFLKNGDINKAPPDGKRYYLDRDELVDFLTTAWVPPEAPPGGDPGMGGPGLGGLQ
jgi:hypothetical protein